MHLAQNGITGINVPSTIFTNANTNILVSVLVGRLLLFAIASAGLFFFYQLVTTGFSYMSSLGDEARLSQLQKQMTNAVMGLLVVIAAFFVMQLIQTVTGANLI
jgi:hypothetical protein